MEIKIIRQRYNPLLKRKEVTFRVEHAQTRGTPSRLQIRTRLAELLKTSLEAVYVQSVKTKNGTMTATGEANIYDVAEQARVVEPQYVILRNSPEEKAEEKSETSKESRKPEEATKEG